MWLKGEPVTIVGRSTFVAVIYHEGSPLPDGTQKLGYSLFDGLSARLITSGSVSCISNGSKLTWAGFSNDCSLLVMDSDGMLSMLVGMAGKDRWPEGSSYSWEWAPMLDTVGLRKSADDNFFPITCQDGKLVCVPLKGGNEYPDAVRRPVTTTLSLRMPVARDTTLDKR
jgi:chromosome transmission fidelity protein 4